MKEETPNDGYGGGFGGASSRRQAEYFKGLHAMYERDEADRKNKEINDKLDKLLDK